jgi:hypothetical protein
MVQNGGKLSYITIRIGLRTLIVQVIVQISGHVLFPFQQQVLQYDHVPFVRHSFDVPTLQSVPRPDPAELLFAALLLWHTASDDLVSDEVTVFHADNQCFFSGQQTGLLLVHIVWQTVSRCHVADLASELVPAAVSQEVPSVPRHFDWYFLIAAHKFDS